MKFHPGVRNAALVATLAAVTATAWATNHALNSTYIPSNAAIDQPVVVTNDKGVLVNDSLAPNESVVLAADVPKPVATVPVIERSTIAQPAITIERRRLSNDERIQAQVMDRLAAMQNVSGKIGVESHEAVVRLTGYTLTNGQAFRAAREARGVVGVKYVENYIKPRVGGSV